MSNESCPHDERCGVPNTSLPAEVVKNKQRTNNHQTFLDRIKVSETGCWEWQHNKDSRGYGMISIKGVYYRAHRYSYEYYKGAIGGFNVLHKCDNPPCCNPDHLFLGNQNENALDMIKKGRSRVPTTPVEDILRIRKLFEEGLTRKKISEQVGVSRRVVETILSGKSWKHITPANFDEYMSNRIVYTNGIPTRVWTYNDEYGYGCAECCNGDRCEEDCTAKFKRPNCPHCGGTGWIKPDKLDNEWKVKYDELMRQNDKLNAQATGWRPLLEEVFQKHESGLLPDRFVYDKIKKFLYGE